METLSVIIPLWADKDLVPILYVRLTNVLKNYR